MKTYYEVLDVEVNSDTESIKEAAQIQLSKIKTIFAILSDAEKRKDYDGKLADITTEKNYYETLAVNPAANVTEIKNSSQAKISEIKTAFKVLSDTEQRKQYDAELNPPPEASLPIISETPYAPPETLSADTSNCPACNAVINQIAEICPKCGVRHRRPARKLTLLLLTLFTGGFGVHRFYLGNYVWGIIYLLFCWTFIPVLFSWIEYIIFLFKSPQQIEESYESHESAAGIAMMLPILLFIVTIVGAISIPAYVDYTAKVKIVEANMLLQDAKTMAEEHLRTSGTFPTNNDLRRMGVITSGTYVASIEAGTNYLQATMNEDSGFAGKTIRLTYEPDSGNWKCSSDSPNRINRKYLPKNCR